MYFLYVLPKKSLSRLVGRLVHWRRPQWLVRAAQSWFIRRYQINLLEAELPIEQYPSIGDLFVRRLRPGARPVSEQEVVHPVDGALTLSGKIEKGLLLQAKGKTYEVDEFLMEDQSISYFEGGTYLTYYLCPTDYHRIHSPIDGQMTAWTHIPGELWPVNAWSTSMIQGLFVKNERVVAWITTPKGPVALVMVGATNVGSIELIADSEVRTNDPELNQVRKKHFSKNVLLNKGDEVGVFHMGSTVIMLYPSSYEFSKEDLSPRPVKMGEGISKDSHIETQPRS